MNNLEWALFYRKIGWSVIPVQHQDKRPLVRWQPYQDKLPTEYELKSWFGHNSPINLGAVTGAISGIIVLDVDDVKAIEGKYLPLTPCARTGRGGLHYFFKHPGYFVRNGVGNGLDLRGDGGFVVVTPSIHYTGNPYEWLISPEDTSFADAPEWIFNLSGARTVSTQIPVNNIVGEGRRNAALASLAGSMHNRGMSKQALTVALHIENKERCQPPLPDEEVDLIITSITRYAPSMINGPQETTQNSQVYTQETQETGNPTEGQPHSALQTVQAESQKTQEEQETQAGKCGTPYEGRVQNSQNKRSERSNPADPRAGVSTASQNDKQSESVRVLQSELDGLLAFSKSNKMPLKHRRVLVSKMLIRWLGENGKFVRSDSNKLMYFYNFTRRLYDLRTQEWESWLYDTSGLNPIEISYRYIHNSCLSEAIKAPVQEVLNVSWFDQENNVLYVSRFDGIVYCLDGTNITEEYNGDHVLFDDSEHEPYMPTNADTDYLHWLTTELPNWNGDRESVGFAFQAWALSTFFTSMCPTKPILVIVGEKGSGKSMTVRLLLKLLLGEKAEISGVPERADAFVAAASAAHIYVMDNLDTFTPFLRDRIARISTGSIDDYRILYSSNEVGHARYRCWLVVTARTPDTLQRDDLVDRIVFMHVDRLSTGFIAENSFIRNAMGFRNAWWGTVLAQLNRIVARIITSGVNTSSNMRLADWTSICGMIAKTSGNEDAWDKFLVTMGTNQEDFMLESDLIVEAVDLWLDNPLNNGTEVNAKALYDQLTAIVSVGNRVPSDWPTSVKGFARRLNLIAKYFSNVGISLTANKNSRSRRYSYIIRRA
jgi:hypothetical protein